MKANRKLVLPVKPT